MDKPTGRAKPRAAIYARISRDKESEEKGVDRQIADCRKLARRYGYEVVEVFSDNDISASTKSRKSRPGYAAMLEKAKAREFEVILAYSNSRLTRRLREYLDLIELYNDYGVVIRTEVSGSHDLSTADGRAAAITVATWDQAEAERTAERTFRAKQEMIAAGVYRGGPRPYGFRKNGLTVKKDEAAVIVETTDAVLAGRTLASIARDLNERGLKTSSGNEWTYARLREMLLRPRNAGLSAHGLPGRRTFRSRDHKERHEWEEIGRAKWPAIVPEEKWRALMALLTDAGRRQQDGNDTRWLGSGIYRCGICGGKMRPAPSRARHLYRCVEKAHLTIAAEKTDEWVLQVVAERVRDERVRATMHPADPRIPAARTERAELERRKATFDDDYANARIPAALWAKSVAKVNESIERIDAFLSEALRASTSSPVLRAQDPGAAFLAAPIDVQRAVLSTVLKVTIRPAKEIDGYHVGAAWSSERIKVAAPEPAAGHEKLYTLIARYGYERRWFKREFTSVDLDGWTYWRLDQGGNGDFINSTPIGSEPFEPAPRCKVHADVEMRVDRITRLDQWHCLECDKTNRPRR